MTIGTTLQTLWGRLAEPKGAEFETLLEMATALNGHKMMAGWCLGYIPALQIIKPAWDQWKRWNAENKDPDGFLTAQHLYAEGFAGMTFPEFLEKMMGPPG